jgi:redox-sensitive bicupin YhaK (pirin superfamily)
LNFQLPLAHIDEAKENAMPAVTVSDITILPRISAGAGLRARTIKSITTAPQGFEGEGFPVRRAFAGVDLAELDPFIHLDQMGEVEYAPGEPKGTPWHPHRGFETVTYIIDGIFDHQDSNGGGGTISNGDTQWMTAGGGILHIETPPESLVMSGGLFHGFQLWVNLPAAKKWSPPAYQDVRANDVALLTTQDGGTLLRVIAGEVDGHSGPGTTQTPITLIHATVAPGAELRLPWRMDYNALVYTMSGHGFVGEEQRPVSMGQLTVFGDGDAIVIRAAQQQESRSPNLELFILGGQPIKEPVAWMGPFVMNTKREVLQAFEDFQKGLLGSIPAIYKADAKKPQEGSKLNRTGKLGGDTSGNNNNRDAKEILDVHGAPTDMQES